MGLEPTTTRITIGDAADAINKIKYLASSKQRKAV